MRLPIPPSPQNFITHLMVEYHRFFITHLMVEYHRFFITHLMVEYHRFFITHLMVEYHRFFYYSFNGGVSPLMESEGFEPPRVLPPNDLANRPLQPLE